MSNATHTRRRRQQTLRKTVPKDQIRHQTRTPPPTEAGDKALNLNQQPTPHNTRRAIWHRLLGTLLSSQGTDAHPPETLRSRARGLFASLAAVVVPRRSGLPYSTPSSGFFTPPRSGGREAGGWSADPVPGRAKRPATRSGWPPAGPSTSGILADPAPCPFLPAGRPREHYAAVAGMPNPCGGEPRHGARSAC